MQARDIPPAWTGQLTPDGRLVAPLLTRGVSRSWELERDDGHLVSRSNGPAGFVPMQGAAKHRGWRVDEAGVRLWSDEPVDVDRAALAGALATERAEAWSGVTWPRGELITGPDLWLASDPDLCQLKASEFGAYGHGRRGAELAERLAGRIRTWDRDHRHGPVPVLSVHPAGTPASDLPGGSALTGRHSTVVLSWPGAARQARRRRS